MGKQKRKHKPPVKNQGSKQSWDEIESIYQQMSTGLLTIVNELNSAIKLIQISGAIQTPEIVNTINTLTTDIREYTDNLSKIHVSHEGKTGLVSDANDLDLCLTAFNDYVILNDKFQAIVFLPMLTISEFLAGIHLTPVKEGKQDEQ